MRRLSPNHHVFNVATAINNAPIFAVFRVTIQRADARIPESQSGGESAWYKLFDAAKLIGLEARGFPLRP